MDRPGSGAAASSRAGRTSLRFRRRNSRCTASILAVHAVAGHEAGDDGSFRVRLRMLLQPNGAVLSAPPHDQQLSAKVQQEYHSSAVSVLVVGA
jgi:hypothetical protein